MVPPSFRPRLRPVESIVVPDERHGRVIVLRDTQGVADGHAVIPPALSGVVARFDGAHTCAEIARAATAELGAQISVEVVVALAARLDEHLMLEGPTFTLALARTRDAFEKAAVRVASHAGGAYPGTKDALASFVDECISRAGSRGRAAGALVGLVAPHIDPWRGALGYGHAYGALQSGLAEDACTFVVLGTSHAPMREPFALCRKAFDTPLGPMEIDREATDELAAACDFDPFSDVLNHKREHSIEFQAVFLRRVLGDRPARIVPILAGLGEHQARGTDPARDARIARFFSALRALVAREPGRVVIVAGADLAHVGPRFGDPAPDAGARAELERIDRASLQHATARAPRSFWSHVVADLETRRVCGLAPVFSTLEALPASARGELLHYEQSVDADGSVVSHAALAFRA